MVKRSDDVKGFETLSRRWDVERTLGWFNRFRRLGGPIRKYDGIRMPIHPGPLKLLGAQTACY
jgi:hypothetical protein